MSSNTLSHSPGRALVTGASGAIGLAVTRCLLEGGTRVLAAAREPTTDEGLAQLAMAHGHRLCRVELDVLEPASLEALAQRCRDHGDRFDLLFNACGVLHGDDGLEPEKRIEDVDGDNLRRVFSLNAIAPILLARALWPTLKHDRRAVFASLSARVGSIGDNRLGGWYAYRASKSAHNQLLRTLAIEMRRRAPKLICAALHPGTVDTPLSAPFSGNVSPDNLFSPRRAARQLLAVIDGLKPEQSGAFLAWDGASIPW